MPEVKFGTFGLLSTPLFMERDSERPHCLRCSGFLNVQAFVWWNPVVVSQETT